MGGSNMDLMKSEDKLSKRTIWKPSVLITVSLILIFGVLYEVSLVNYLLYHTVIEFFAIFVGLSLTLISITTINTSKNRLFTKIGLLYLFVSTVDFVHTLGYKGMNIFPNWTANEPTQLWILGRSLEVFGMFLLFPLRLRNKSNLYFISIAASMTFAGLLSIFFKKFPDCLIEGSGLTPFKITMEYVLIALALAVVIDIQHLHHKTKEQRPCFCTQITISMLLTALGEFFFTLYTDVYGFFNFLGHASRFFSYYVLLHGLIVQSLIDPINTMLTEIKSQKEELERIAYYDTLTKLYSRSFFEEIVKKHLEIIERNKSSSTVVLIDVDTFKSINDTYGHKVGDRVLEFVGRSIAKAIRSSDIAARYGGDEFILILSESNSYNAVKAVQRIKNILSSENPFNFPVSISYGVAEFSGKSNYETALQSADISLYEMKRKKRTENSNLNQNIQ